MLNQKTIHPYLYAGLFNIGLASNTISNENLLRIICKHFNVDFNFLRANNSNRKRELVTVRQVYFYFKKTLTTEVLEVIGGYLGKDHATVIHSIKMINNYKEFDKIFKKELDKISFEIKMAKNNAFNTDADKIISKIRNN